MADWGIKARGMGHITLIQGVAAHPWTAFPRAVHRECLDSSAMQGQEILQKWHSHMQVWLLRAGHKVMCGCRKTGLPTVPQAHL